MNTKQMSWTHAPAVYSVRPDAIEITTEPGTDLWQRTYYHFRNDNAPILQMETEEQFFSFIVKTSFESSSHRFDQCGIAMYLDSENWLKASIEYENDVFQHLGSVVTNHGYSDWATTEVPADVKAMWYRLSRRNDDFCIECSEDGELWRQMRSGGASQIKKIDADLRLSRASGTIQVLATHRLSDFEGVGAAGSEAVNIAKDLISSCETRIQLAQDTRPLAITREAIGLTDAECDLIGSWGAGQRGRALWKVGRGGGSHAVQLMLSRTEEQLFETDEKMVI